MKRSTNRASEKKRRAERRQLGLEALEAKRVLNGDMAEFGFIDVPGGFAFQITGTDFQEETDSAKFTEFKSANARADNMVIWTNFLNGNIATNFFIEWQDTGGTWHSLSGSVSAGDIADEAQDRGLVIGDFRGFQIKGLAGNDTIHANGGGSVGTLPNSQVNNEPITQKLIGTGLTVDGNDGNDFIDGSPEDDVIRGGAGNDTIAGNAGNDMIMGGAGDDILSGGDGFDTIDGDDGKDKIDGDAGNDKLSGGAGGRHDQWRHWRRRSRRRRWKRRPEWR